MKPTAILFFVLYIFLVSCEQTDTYKSGEIIIENDEVRLIINSNGTSKSLVYKPTNEECLMTGENVPVFSVTQERPFNNEVKLAHPNKRTTFFSDTIYREGEKLIVGFEIIPYEAVIKIKETED